VLLKAPDTKTLSLETGGTGEVAADPNWKFEAIGIPLEGPTSLPVLIGTEFRAMLKIPVPAPL